MDGWLSVFDDDDRAGFFSEMRRALDCAEEAGSADAIETCLGAWRKTAEALSDPQVRETLTSPLDGAGFGEVPRP